MLEWWRQIASWIQSSHAWMVNFQLIIQCLLCSIVHQKYMVQIFSNLAMRPPWFWEPFNLWMALSVWTLVFDISWSFFLPFYCTNIVPILKLLGKLLNLVSWKVAICLTHQLACHECEDNTYHPLPLNQ